MAAVLDTNEILLTYFCGLYPTKSKMAAIISVYSRFSSCICVTVQMLGVAGRSQQEQIDALLAEISDEVDIDARTAHTNTDVTDRLNNASRSSIGLCAKHAIQLE